MADGDFDEEEFWSLMAKRDKKDKKECYNSPLRIMGGSGSRTILPKTSSATQNADFVIGAGQRSAPVNIPDWDKIYKQGFRTSWHGEDDHDVVNGDGDGDDDDGKMVPPHEMIARKLSRSQVTPFSVCEGVGRTLKGRDLSKVRNAVLTSTGFLE